ncbi:hypothetical protein ORG37_25090, partial [Rahnella perminowiae]|uniref:hypothetical protein n=1 Tax=Rahnella perminowiae TaxID=2816244 RepID=UPI00224B383B
NEKSCLTVLLMFNLLTIKTKWLKPLQFFLMLSPCHGCIALKALTSCLIVVQALSISLVPAVLQQVFCQLPAITSS